jgi:hypothetical protein
MSKARNLANLLADGAVGASELASTLDLSGKTLTLPAGTALPSQSGQNGNFLTTDGTSASWGAVGGGATGGGSDAVFIENDQTVTTNYTIPSGKNAMSTGPVTIDSGVTVTVSSGSRYVVI